MAENGGSYGTQLSSGSGAIDPSTPQSPGYIFNRVRLNKQPIKNITYNGKIIAKIPFKVLNDTFNTNVNFDNSTVPVGLTGYQQVITDFYEFEDNLSVSSGSPLSAEYTINSTIKNLLPFGSSLSRKAYSFADHEYFQFKIDRLTDALWFKVNFGSADSSNNVKILLKDPTRQEGKNIIASMVVRMVGNYYVLDFLKSWNGDNTFDTVRTVEVANSLSDGNSHIAYIYFKMDSNSEINSPNIYYGFVRDDGVSQHYSYNLNSIGIKPYRSPFLITIDVHGTGNINYPNQIMIFNYSLFRYLNHDIIYSSDPGGGWE